MAVRMRRARNARKSNLLAEGLASLLVRACRSFGLGPRIRGRLGGIRSSARACGGNTESYSGLKRGEVIFRAEISSLIGVIEVLDLVLCWSVALALRSLVYCQFGG